MKLLMFAFMMYKDFFSFDRLKANHIVPVIFDPIINIILHVYRTNKHCVTVIQMIKKINKLYKLQFISNVVKVN